MLREKKPPLMALTNDNFIGYVSRLWAACSPKWIEMAAATPIWTSIMAFYIEGDQGHLMGETAFAQRARAAVRGNVVSFQVQLESVFAALQKIVSRDEMQDLPHDEHVLAELVRFEFKVGSEDLTHHFPDSKLRAHVVMRLGYELIEKNHAPFRASESMAAIKARYAAQVAQRYPLTADEEAVPETERVGIIPPAVLNATRKSTTSDHKQENKHATPADAPSNAENVFDHVRLLRGGDGRKR